MSTRGFGLIDEFEYNRKGSMFADRLRFLDIKLSDWLFRAIDACEVLPISRDYFRLRRPIDRRLYELARKHCGQQPSWRVSLDVLQKKTGSSAPRKKFAFALRGLIASGHLPDYRVRFDDDMVTFHPTAAKPLLRLCQRRASPTFRSVIGSPTPGSTHCATPARAGTANGS